MEFLLTFYWIFSIIFMLGYLDFNGENSLWVKIVGGILALILAPILFPLNLGYHVYKNS